MTPSNGVVEPKNSMLGKQEKPDSRGRAMRCLNETGLMPNRLRMVTASFLCKTLLVDWKKGEKYFAEKLLDFDLAANNGGWQWSSSSGCDSQPYFRIFNPLSQSQKFDPEGNLFAFGAQSFQSLTQNRFINPMHTPFFLIEKISITLNR